MRDVENRYKGLPPRTPEMLYNIVRKFYRGAVSHYELIQEKKAEVRKAWDECQYSGDDEQVRDSLHTLFLEYHFYTTCWLQIDLALYRLAADNEELARVREAFRTILHTHLEVRRQLDDPSRCVQAQHEQTPDWSCIKEDAYSFGGIRFTVDDTSLQQLHELYEAVQATRA